jgi:hypothetical protein
VEEEGEERDEGVLLRTQDSQRLLAARLKGARNPSRAEPSDDITR